LVKAGKVREVGASNYSAARLADALHISDLAGLCRFVALQEPYNLMDRRSYEHDLRPLVLREGLALLPYYSLAKGFLTGKYRECSAGVASPRAPAALAYLDERGAAVLAAVDAVAEARSVPPAAVALAWLRSQPTVAAPIASARTPEQLDELLQSVRLDLTDSELEELSRASDEGPTL
jgi:aryl-alcohol dehydrogenase-like predicted oxidoreductase